MNWTQFAFVLMPTTGIHAFVAIEITSARRSNLSFGGWFLNQNSSRHFYSCSACSYQLMALAATSAPFYRDWKNNRAANSHFEPFPDGLIRQSETSLPCSIPLLEAQVPKDARFVIKQIRPSKNQMASMPQAKPPAPSCAVEK
jgi:hypothetical protein